MPSNLEQATKSIRKAMKYKPRKKMTLADALSWSKKKFNEERTKYMKRD